ncbi:MAG: hypothetical protein M3321_10710, partial [Actinomycetota bacterium]|nr:hypothetical protein [Actinomycetota bacterium]
DRAAYGPFQRSCPIVPVTAASLEDELVALAGDHARRRELAAAGRAYVERVHLARLVARAALAVYEHARGGGGGLFEATADGIRPLPQEERRLRRLTGDGAA